jgi:hypothetical protein
MMTVGSGGHSRNLLRCTRIWCSYALPAHITCESTRVTFQAKLTNPFCHVGANQAGLCRAATHDPVHSHRTYRRSSFEARGG